MKGKGRLLFSNLSGDLAGGTTAAVLALPEAMAYGAIVFAPLGEKYVSVGAMAGLLALCFSNLGAACCRGVKVMNSGPYSLTSLMLASAVAIIAEKAAGGDPALVLGLLFLIVFMSGLFQVMFGILKVGELVKYIPYPVTSGLLNGTAILIFLGQIRPMLGLSKESAFGDFAAAQPLTLGVGLITAGTIWLGPKLIRKVPPPFLGIATGTAAYYGLLAAGYGSALGPMVGDIPMRIPIPAYAAKFWQLGLSPGFFETLAELIPLALGIAVVASLQSLVASVAADDLMGERSDTNRELIGQGVGNMVSSLFGGIASAGSQSRAMANYEYGGRTALSRVASGAFALAVVLFIGPAVSRLPAVVLAGTLVVLAIRAFDSWSFSLLGLVFRRKRGTRQIIYDLVIVVLVTAILAGVGVFEAVGAGVLISVVFFILRMGKDVVRREYDGARVRSDVLRAHHEIEYLEEHGHRIRVLELEGSLFFGTADRIARAIEEATDGGADFVVVDFRQVSDIDSTGANILLKTGRRCREGGKYVLLTSVDSIRSGDALSAQLSDEEGGRDDKLHFETLGDGLAWAEDRLLDEGFGRDRYDREHSLVEIDAFAGFARGDLEVLARFLERVEHEERAVIFAQGGPGDRVFFLTRGKVSVLVDLPDAEVRERLSTLCPGTIFGEMAILDHKPRSASVVADTHVSCFVLSCDRLDTLTREHPDLANRLLQGIARDLSMRIRVANRVATELKG